MELTNLLSLVYYTFREPTISGLTSWIAAFINLFPSIALGVIIFTVAIKLVTFPLDFYSRASMRRNSLKMEQMRPQLEKLQKQYANDKEKYNQKMMALYKKEGYSMFGACLPTILTLVFFIIVLNSFNSYSTHQNIKYLYNMNTAFNNVIDNGIEEVEGYITRDKNGALVINDSKIFTDAAGANEFTSPDGKLRAVYTFTTGERTDGTVTYTTENGYVQFIKNISTEGENYVYTVPVVNIIMDKFRDNTEIINEEGKTFAEFYAEHGSEYAGEIEPETAAAEAFILDVQQTSAAEKYRDEAQSLLWIKNIWMPDSAFQHPVYKDYDSFNAKYKLSNYTTDPNQYTNLTAKLETEKNQINGYFILVLLTAGSSLILQLVMSKSQKAQTELQSVDGRGAQTQKIMMWMMPIMMAVFAFMYTAAFSLYIITSSFTSLLSTLLINKIVDIRFKKKLEEEENKKAGGHYRK